MQQQPQQKKRGFPSFLTGALVTGAVVALCVAAWLLRDKLRFLSSITGASGRFGIEAVPARETKGERWGLVGLDGEFIVSNEWENQPAFPSEGIVRVRNRDGRLEFYTVGKRPRQVGESYKEATPFREGLAVVVKEKQPVTWIDSKGSTVLELRQAGGYTVEKAGEFREGLAVFETDQGKCGYVGRNGEVVIRPDYNECSPFREGLAHVASREPVPDSNTERPTRGFINTKGEAVVRLRANVEYGIHSDGLIPYTDGNQEWGVMRADGEKIIKPSSRFRMIMYFSNGHAPFFDGTYWGAVAANGDIVIRPKYQALFVSGDLIGVKDNGKFGFIDLKGDEVIRPEFDGATPFLGSTALAKEGSRWVLIDRRGKAVSKRDFEEIANPAEQLVRYFTGELVASDFFDAGTVIAALPLAEMSDRMFAGVSAWAPVTDLMSKLSVGESELPLNQRQIVLPPHPAGPSQYQIMVMFNDVVRRWSSSSPNAEARASGVKLQVNLQGKGRGRDADVAELIVGRLSAGLQQYRILKLDAISDKNKVVFGNDKGEYIVAVVIAPNQVTIQFQFSGDLVPTSSSRSEPAAIAATTLDQSRAPPAAEAKAKSPAEVGGLPASFLGRWEGTVLPRGRSPYPVMFELTSPKTGEPAGTYYLPTFQCRGQLWVSEVSDSRLLVQAPVTEGKGTCSDGSVEMRLSAGRMTGEVRSPDGTSVGAFSAEKR